ncbi:hypothetical protein B0H10DRAFT_2211472 [Mycena sp. CBHHK59/15]|nr:hypothetical protein B0H10DRAFT_2211472 [Mycena sp. CBHHK59/15]
MSKRVVKHTYPRESEALGMARSSATRSTRTCDCAQNPDGSIRNASEIQFFNDVDDQHPISGPLPARTFSSGIHAFFTVAARPVGKVAGSRRSSRTSRPRASARVTDPNNAEGSTSSGKRKLTSPAPGSRKAPRISKAVAAQSSDDESDADSDVAPPEDGTEADDTDSQDLMDVDEYNSIKAMGDADHAHASFRLLSIEPLLYQVVSIYPTGRKERIFDIHCLTHLSFHDDHIPNSVCQSALVHLKSLDVLAIVFSSRALLDMFVPDHEVFVTDPRFVLLMVTDPLEDWETVKTRRAGQHLLNFTLEELQEKLAQNRARLEALRRESECEAARRELRHEGHAP